MRHAPGQPADSLHLLRLAQLILQPAPFAHVAKDAEQKTPVISQLEK